MNFYDIANFDFSTDKHQPESSEGVGEALRTEMSRIHGGEAFLCSRRGNINKQIFPPFLWTSLQILFKYCTVIRLLFPSLPWNSGRTGRCLKKIYICCVYCVFIVTFRVEQHKWFSLGAANYSQVTVEWVKKCLDLKHISLRLCKAIRFSKVHQEDIIVYYSLPETKHTAMCIHTTQ